MDARLTEDVKSIPPCYGMYQGVGDDWCCRCKFIERCKNDRELFDPVVELERALIYLEEDDANLTEESVELKNKIIKLVKERYNVR